MEDTPPVRPKKTPGARYFLLANAFYLLLVQGLSLTIQPVGRDFAAFAGQHEAPGMVLLQGLYSLLGTQVALYHTINLVLLYGVIVCVFFLTRMLVGGPWWLSSLSAALLMANPIKSEAIYQSSGVLDLAPALLALGVLTAYVYHQKTHSKSAYLAAWLLWTATVLIFPQTWGLILVLFLVNLSRVVDCHYKLACFPAFLPPLLASFVVHTPSHGWFPDSVQQWLTPLYLVLFPVGLLPETELRFIGQPHLWWLAALVFCGLLAWIAWGAKSRALVFGITAAGVFRLFPNQPVDLVHMAGGGQMIVPTALLSIAFCALCWRMIQHKKWVRPVVFVTTMLCVLFFVLQLRELFAWRHAAQQALAFQARTRLTHEAAPDQQLAILPNFSYHRSAPIQLHQAVAVDGPFSVAYPAAPLLSLRYYPPGHLHIEILELKPQTLKLRVTGEDRASALPRDFADRLWPGARVELEKDPEGFVITLVGDGEMDPFPLVPIPYRNGGQLP